MASYKMKHMKLRQSVFVVYTFLLIIFLPASGQGAQEVVVAFSEFPPFKMVVDGKKAGIDVEILSIIAERMDLELSFRHGTFKECLEMMENGEADLITSLLRRPERERYILYVQPRYKKIEEKVFYVAKGKRNLIRLYDDLKNLRIGVKSGVKYAPIFDNDKELNKIPSPDIATNLKKLVSGEIDAFIDSRDEGDFRIKALGYSEKVSKALFNFRLSDSSYMGISRKSRLSKRSKEFGKQLKYLVDKGIIRKILDKYL